MVRTMSSTASSQNLRSSKRHICVFLLAWSIKTIDAVRIQWCCLHKDGYAGLAGNVTITEYAEQLGAWLFGTKVGWRAE